MRVSDILNKVQDNTCIALVDKTTGKIYTDIDKTELVKSPIYHKKFENCEIFDLNASKTPFGNISLIIRILVKEGKTE